MTISGRAAMLRIYLGDADHAGGRPAYHAIVELLRSRGFAGATVLRGIEGFGAKHQVHTDRILSRSVDMPIAIEVVDQEDRLRSILTELDAMIGDGMIVMIPVEVMTHRSGS
jgi:PII-like signaling protein